MDAAYTWWLSAVAGNLVWLYLAVTRVYQGVRLLREKRLHDGFKKLAWGFAFAGVPALLASPFFGGDRFFIEGAFMFQMLALFVLAWRPLHRHINAFGIIALYIFLMFSWIALVEPQNGGGVGVALASIAFGVTFPLLFCRQKPIEERDVSVAHAVVHGLWDSLAREGLPPDEIERLKRLTPKERERVMAKLREPVYTYPRKVKHIYGTFPGDYVWDEDRHA